jgi:hypothetical protein
MATSPTSARRGWTSSSRHVGRAVFLGNANTAADNAHQRARDSVLRRVVTGALGLPQELAIEPVETQARACLTRLQLEQAG